MDTGGPSPTYFQPVPKESSSKSFDYNSAGRQSLLLLFVEHGFRMAQPKTRAELGGKFFEEWGNAVSGLHGWSDGDGWFTQYVGHPVQGAWVGYIQVQNDPSGRMHNYNESSSYWKSRLKATAFAFGYEVQWHLGPVSEATIGHVGKKPGTLGYSEFVTSPLGGLALIVAEDALDEKIIEKLERQTDGLNKRRLYRTFLNPSRAVANLMRWRKPWHRDRRKIN